MHTVTVNIQDSVLDKVIYFLKNLPLSDVQIMSDVVAPEHKAAEQGGTIFQRTSGILLAQHVDPVHWQQQMRTDEWR